MNYTGAITEQMGRAGQPTTTTQTTTTDEGADLGQLGVLIALLLGDTLKKGANANEMIGEIAEPRSAELPGMGLQGLGGAVPAAPAPALGLAGPAGSLGMGSGGGVGQLTPQQIQQLFFG